MADSPLKPPLQRPPGYKDPSASGSSASIPVSKPPAARNKPRLPTSYKPKKRKSSCCRLCCCVFCFLILFLIVVVSLAGALFYLIFDPKLPLFHLLAFRISSFKVAPTPDGSYLDAQVSIRVEFKNPNDKLAIKYGKIEYDVMVGQAAEFGQRELQGFTQGRRSTTTVKADSGVKGKMLGVEDSTRLVSKYQSKAMEVKVEARTAVGVVAQGWAVGPIPVKLDCESKLKNIEAGDMPTCNINLLRCGMRAYVQSGQYHTIVESGMRAYVQSGQYHTIGESGMRAYAQRTRSEGGTSSSSALAPPIPATTTTWPATPIRSTSTIRQQRNLLLPEEICTSSTKIVDDLAALPAENRECGGRDEMEYTTSRHRRRCFAAICGTVWRIWTEFEP
ncbi:NDR1/HIN1-like protein 2, partial [Cucurbita argyrosperma subsp. argyrosperma]